MEQIYALAEFFNVKVLLVMALIFIPLERIFHLHEDQKVLRQHFSVDMIYFFVIAQVTKLALGLVLLGAMIGINLVVPPIVGQAIKSQHLALQVVEAIIIADIGVYFAHRIFHAVPFLWRFHAVHHSSEQMDWMSAYRVHPVDQVLTKSISILPLYALGYAEVAMAILIGIQTVHALLVHANVRMTFGPLKWLLVSPQFHHWHHANERSGYDKNFAAQLPVLDWLGGTMHLPGNSYPRVYGATNAPPANNPVAQMVDPFKPRRRAKAKAHTVTQPAE